MSIRDSISKDLSIRHSWVDRIISRAPYAYKKYRIPKKNGGMRDIAQPARETKALQYWVISNIFEQLPIHNCVTAYKEGAGIKVNAEAHKNNNFIAKFDFSSFFTSIKDENIKALLLRQNLQLTEADLNDVVRICCIHNHQSEKLNLSIGAPSSPIISNTILFEFDNKVSDFCTENNIIYTRYADDLTFSSKTPFSLLDLDKQLKDIVKSIEYLNLRFNNKKRTYVSKKHQRRVTGLVLTNDGKVSLGREKKRLLRSMIHRYCLELLSPEEKDSLQGLLAFAKDVEPEFVARMRGKYSSTVIDSILKNK